MPFPAPWLITGLVVTLVGGLSSMVLKGCSFANAMARKSMTRVLFSQFCDELEKVPENQFPATQEQLLELLRKANIDWNGCEIKDGQLLDAWGHRIKVEYDKSKGVWSFRSASQDGKFETADDIVVQSEARSQELDPFAPPPGGYKPPEVIRDPAGIPYFPEGRQAYYGEAYKAAELPSFQNLKLSKGEVRFRVGYFPSFSKTLILSYERTREGAFISIYRTQKRDSEVHGPDGIELTGKVRIAEEYAKRMEAAAVGLDVRDPLRRIKVEQQQIFHGLDGQTWVLEVVDENGYTMADIWCPELFKHHEMQIRELPEFKDFPQVDMRWFERFCKDMLTLADMEIPSDNPNSIQLHSEPGDEVVEDE